MENWPLLEFLGRPLRIKPESNMLNILLIIPSSTSQKITHYPYFIIISLYIYCSYIIFCINVSGIYKHLEKQELDMYRFCCRYSVQILVI